MAKTKISELDAAAANNTDINSVDVSEGCAPSGINNAIREMGAMLKRMDNGTDHLTNPNITGDLDVDNIRIDGNTISSTDTNGNVTVDPNGSGQINLSANVDVTGNIESTGRARAFGSTGFPAFSHNTDTDTGMNPDGSGNIQFTTQGSERMRIDSSGRVGIGTTNPSSKLQVQTTHTSSDVTTANSNATLNIANSGAGNGVYNAIKFAANQQDMYIMSFNNSAQASRRLGFFLGSVAGDAVSDERLSILGNGNVGIGTTSPSRQLHINNASESNIRLQGGSDYAELRVKDADNAFSFHFGASERMRIDSSGSLLVGMTSSSVATDGSSFNVGGSYAHHTSNNGVALYLNRRTSDGDILSFRKDNTTVGSIGGSVGSYGYMHLGSGATGLQFTNAFNHVIPYNPSSLSARDNAIDLGSSLSRFKDLYLSGGAYLGGTGSANKLDDYEEGTWTPAVTMDTGTSTVTTYGRYVKIGLTVYATFYIQFTAAASSPTVNFITGFPFAHENSGTYAGVGAVRENSQTGFNWHVRMNNNATTGLLRRYDNSNTVAVNYVFIGSVTYTTS